MIAALGILGAALYIQSLSGDSKTFEYWKLHALITSYFAFGVAFALCVLSFVCLVLQRQAEYALFLKETLTARNEGRIGDAPFGASSLSKAA